MPTTVDGVIPAGEKAPSFRLPMLGGGEAAIPQPGSGGLTLAVFFKNSCPTCRLTFPFLQRLHEQVSDRGVRVYGVSQDGADGAASFAHELGLTMPMLLDGDDYPISRAYDLVAVPTLYLVDAEGIVHRSLAGFNRRELTAIAEDLAASVSAPSPTLFHQSDSVPEFKPG